MKTCTILAVVVLISIACACANAAGEWAWILKTNPTTGDLAFSGVSGSATPIVFTGTIYNNDQAGDTMSFDGLTLKTDDLQPSNESLFAQLLALDDSVINPGSFIVGSGQLQKITIGIFDLSSAAPGTYRFKLIGSASYDNPTVQANPDQIVSDTVTVTVTDVPEPVSAAVLICGAVGLAMRKRRR